MISEFIPLFREGIKILKHRLSSVNMRGAKLKIKRDMATCFKNLLNVDRMIEKIKSLENVEVVVRERGISVTYYDLELDFKNQFCHVKIPIGSMKWFLPINGDPVLEEHWGPKFFRKYITPHVREDGSCFGTFREAISDSMNKLDIVNAIMMLQVMLTSYNPDDNYIMSRTRSVIGYGTCDACGSENMVLFEDGCERCM